jgi:hypothetical protein
MTWEDMAPIAEMVGYQPHFGQIEIHQDRSRFRCPLIGRRFGKSKLSSFEATATSVLGGWVMAAAPTYDLSSVVFEECLTMILGSKLQSLVMGYRTAKGDQVINLASGGRIVGKSTDNQKSLVSRGWDLIVFDEAAKEEDPEAWHRHLRPALMDREGGAIFPTTPEGDNWLKEIWERGKMCKPGYRSWQLPSFASPLLTKQELAEITADMTEADYRQEILAEFLDGKGAVFPGYAECLTSTWEDNPRPGGRYVLGVDLAQYEDWTVIAVFDVQERRFVHLDRFNQIDYPMQEHRIKEMSRRWNDAPILIDATNNQSTWQHLEGDVFWAPVEPFIFSNLSKREAVNTLALAIQQKEVELLDRETELGATAAAEVGAYRYERLPSGMLRMSAPTGRHDDIVIALVLAYAMALRYAFLGAPPIRRTDESTSQFRGQHTPPAKKGAAVTGRFSVRNRSR